MITPDELSEAAEVTKRLPDAMEVFQAIRVLYLKDPERYKPVLWNLTSSLDLHAKFREGLLRAEALSLLGLLHANATTA